MKLFETAPSHSKISLMDRLLEIVKLEFGVLVFVDKAKLKNPKKNPSNKRTTNKN